MNIFLLLATSTLFYLITSFSNPKCLGKRYSCGDYNKANICVNVSEFTNKQHLLQVCPQGKYCPIKNEVSFNKPLECVDALPLSPFLPGEACSQATDCYSGNCVLKICQGTMKGGFCKSHEDCDSGLYCNKQKICTDQLSFDDECTEDYQCLNNCVCNLGKCTFFYSLENGLKADNPKACLSGYINKTNSSCTDGPVSQIKGKPCEKDEECLLLDKNGHLAGNSICQCGFNAGSFSYCSLSEGDDEYLQTISLFQWILYTNIKCHTLLRYGPCRYLYHDEVINYQKAVKFYEMHSDITFNDVCIQAIYTNEYWGINCYKATIFILLILNFLL